MKKIISLIFIKVISVLKNVGRAMVRLLLQLESKANSVLNDEQKKRVFPDFRKRVCHYDELFISHKGEVFPCCQVWMCPGAKIGHIDDHDICERIKNFYYDCSCQRFRLIKASPEDRIKISSINIEFSLRCQGKCTLCSVNAPEWEGEYDYYDSLTKIMKLFNPDKLWVQGGEVLIQRKSLEWLESQKKLKPGIIIGIVTNGNVSTDMVNRIEGLFSTVYVSILGFQKETYERTMGMDFKKMTDLVEELARRKKVSLILKYLITPINIHEANVFLDWAINLCPSTVLFIDAKTSSYINSNTNDKFWMKICDRTGQKIKKTLIERKNRLLENEVVVRFSVDSTKILGIESDWEEFRVENGLQDKVLIDWW